MSVWGVPGVQSAGVRKSCHRGRSSLPCHKWCWGSGTQTLPVDPGIGEILCQVFQLWTHIEIHPCEIQGDLGSWVWSPIWCYWNTSKRKTHLFLNNLIWLIILQFLNLMLENGEIYFGNSNEIGYCVPKFCSYKNILSVWWRSSLKTCILTLMP